MSEVILASLKKEQYSSPPNPNSILTMPTLCTALILGCQDSFPQFCDGSQIPSSNPFISLLCPFFRNVLSLLHTIRESANTAFGLHPYSWESPRRLPEMSSPFLILAPYSGSRVYRFLHSFSREQLSTPFRFTTIYSQLSELPCLVWTWNPMCTWN